MDRSTLQELNEQLVETQAGIRHRERLERHLDAVEGALQYEKGRLWELKERLEKEEEEVKELGGLSLPNLFHKVFGDLNEKREEERRELLAVKLKYDDCEETIKDIEEEAGAIRAQIAELGALDAERNALLTRKEQLLSKADDALAKNLLDLSVAYVQRECDSRELEEALQAGDSALHAVAAVLKALQSVDGWGAGGTPIGNLIAGTVKQTKLDKARSKVHHAQHSLHNFVRELHDLPESSIPAADLDAFTSFTECFFEGLIADWIARSEIRRSREEVNRVKKHLEETLEQLRTHSTVVRKEVESIENKRRELLEKA